MRNKKLPLKLRVHVWDFYRMHFRGGKLFDEQVIMKDLAPSLRQQILEWNAKDMLTKVPVISFAQLGFSSNVASLIVPQVAFKDDVVFREGSIADKM